MTHFSINFSRQAHQIELLWVSYFRIYTIKRGHIYFCVYDYMFKEGPKLIKWGRSQCPCDIYGDLVYNLKIKQGHGDHNVTRSLVCSLLKYKDQFLKCFQPIPPFIFLYSLFNSNVLRSGKILFEGCRMSKGIKQFFGGAQVPQVLWVISGPI